MKKQFALYFAICTMAFVCTSCLNDDDDETIKTYPYASLLSFSIGNLELPTSSVTEEGKDTVIVKTVVGSLYKFIIDDKTGLVYNPDSLPKGSDVTKVTTTINSDGIAYFYSAENDTYDPVTSADSIDFSSPRKLIIVSTDGTHVKEYTVNLNVHNTDPDAMYWESLSPLSVVSPMRSIAFDNKLFVYGRNDANEVVVASMDLAGSVSWSTPKVLDKNFTDANLKEMLQFDNSLYVTEESGALVASQDGVNWTENFVKNLTLKRLLASSDDEGKMWVVANCSDAVCDSIMYSTDGKTFVATEALPKDFPLYNISSAVYPLNTNPDILRYVLVGYPASHIDAKPVVWSKLSTERTWMQLVPAGNGKFNCPALENLTVMRYDGNLYAFGGAGVVNDTVIEPFATYYISNDNGLTWLPSSDEKIVLPESLLGNSAPFAATVDNNQRMWIVVGGEEPVAWRGVINRLAY